MTLAEVIRRIEAVASSQPSVNTIVRSDVFRLNTLPSVRYGVFAWTQGQHSTSIDSDFITFNFSLFYVDRLTEDRRNETEVQSIGISTIDNIIRTLDDEGIEAGSYTFTTFNQRFADDCAGVFTGVSFSVPVSLVCEETFEDREVAYE